MVLANAYDVPIGLMPFRVGRIHNRLDRETVMGDFKLFETLTLNANTTRKHQTLPLMGATRLASGKMQCSYTK